MAHRTAPADALSFSSSNGESVIQGPAWNLESEYIDFSSGAFAEDLNKIEKSIVHIQSLSNEIKELMAQELDGAIPLTVEQNRRLVHTLQQMTIADDNAFVLFANLATYTSCRLTVDAKDAEAKKRSSQLDRLAARMTETIQPANLFLSRCRLEIIETFLNHQDTAPGRFLRLRAREEQATLLGEAEELLITGLSVPGFQSWSRLYSAIAGTLKCNVQLASGCESMGLAQAAGLLRGGDESKRRAAWLAIQEAWKSQEEPCAAILNSLADWRLRLFKSRSHTQPVSHLFFPLRSSRIEDKTLNAMMDAVYAFTPHAREAMSLMAQVLGKTKLDPWDLLAPAPLENNAAIAPVPFAKGLQLVTEAFSQVSPDFGQFVEMMRDNQWIEGRILPNKNQGAYCTGFPKSRSPRVFQTYMGSLNDISTLAHELGHAYHSWIMRDMPLNMTHYPMTLAETASIFAETVLADHLAMTSTSRSEKLQIAWSNASDAVSFLLNIPARFEFENRLYESAKDRALTADELSNMTEAAWMKWYGSGLSQMDRMFWASKLHFSMSRVSFYNFPYTFGYLFSLGIYARRSTLGSRFVSTYNELLRDTGIMTAEDLVKKHFNEDITKPEFWQKSLAVVENKILQFKNLISVDGSGLKSQSQLPPPSLDF